MTTTPIHHVSDTAFWVATYRAQESERPDALFHDPLAARLVAGRGRDIARRMQGSAAVAWSVSLRTVIIDTYISEAVARGVDTILNLGAGLDTRPYRMDLPPTLRWIEVDFPDVIAFKKERLVGETPRCHLTRIGLDLSLVDERRTLFGEIAANAPRVLVLTEGVVPYLTLDQTGSLATDLHDQPRFAYWVLDRFSKGLIAGRKRAKHAKQMVNAPFQFDPDDWDAFFASRGWQIATLRFLAAEGERLGRDRFAGAPWWLKFVWPFIPEAKKKDLREMAGYALMERV